MTTSTRIVAAMFLALAVPALAGAQSREEMQVYADLRMLQEEVAKLQLSVNQLTELTKAQGKKIDDQADATLKGFANQQVMIKDQGTQMGTVQEKLNDNTVRVTQITQEFTAVTKGLGMVTQQLNTLTNLLQSPVNGGSAAATPDEASAPPSGAPANGPLAPISMPASPSRYLDAAMNDYMANRLDNAIDGLTDFIKKFPDAPDAAKAQYYIGRSYYDEHKYAEAIAAYGLVVSKYSGSDYVPTAYYEQGLSYVELKKDSNAQKVFDIILKQFPSSTEATLVRQRSATKSK